MTPPDPPETVPAESEKWQESFYRIYLRTNGLYKYTMYYAWRFSEIHIYKLILFLLVLLSVYKVNEPYSFLHPHRPSFFVSGLRIQCRVDRVSDDWFNRL